MATVATLLAGAGLPRATIDPRRIKDFAQALGRSSKLDTLDAEVITRVPSAFARTCVRPITKDRSHFMVRRPDGPCRAAEIRAIRLGEGD